MRADGTIDTDRDVLDWLKFAQSETDGIKFELTLEQVDEVIDQYFNNLIGARPLVGCFVFSSVSCHSSRNHVDQVVRDGNRCFDGSIIYITK